MSDEGKTAIDHEGALDTLFSVLRVDSTWGQEGKLAVKLAEDLERRGFDEVRLVDALPGRPSVVGRIRGTGGGKTIILNGHLDIYELAEDWSHDPFQPTIEDGKVFGAGVADEKAGTAALLSAASLFLDPARRPQGDIVFMGVAAHFEGGLGTRAILDAGITADGGITCEPSNLALNDGHRGAAYIDVITYGKQAHTTAKEQGYNAIEAMAAVIEQLQSLESMPHTPDSLGGPILNIGTIQGGTKHNQVPDRCEISIDVRLPASLSADDVLAQVRQLLDTIATTRAGFRAAASFSPYWLSGPRHPSSIATTEPIAQCLAAARRAVGAGQASVQTLPVWSDMCVLNSRGIPTLNLGPGGPPYNWADEYVTVEEYLTAVSIYADTIARFCGVAT